MNFTQLSSPATGKRDHLSFDYRRFNRSGVSFSTGVHIKTNNQVSYSTNCPKVSCTSNLVSWNTGAWFVAYKWLTFQWARTLDQCPMQNYRRGLSIVAAAAAAAAGSKARQQNDCYGFSAARVRRAATASPWRNMP